NDDRRRIVFAKLEPPDHDRRQLVLRERRMFAVTLGPQHTLRTPSFIFQPEEGKLVALLRGAYLKVSDYTATRDANSGREFRKLGGLDRLHSLQCLDVTLEWM